MLSVESVRGTPFEQVALMAISIQETISSSSMVAPCFLSSLTVQGPTFGWKGKVVFNKGQTSQTFTLPFGHLGVSENNEQTF